MKCICKVIAQEGEIMELECECEGIATKKKRKPSKYNLFMKECIKRKTGPIQERFIQCAAEYKQQKNV